MTSTDLRNKVQEYGDTADVRLLKMIKVLAEPTKMKGRNFPYPKNSIK